ncbi:NAD-dependent epimerase/dehydratase family protein [Caldifermentibacillus hisashii]|uniref:NAD-dependent epimerase/dehydratase family protein n=1 Tax=Caldifermentibacillus hisashii TaxID=996558 RepID=A0ABU9K3Z9_9BACI
MKLLKNELYRNDIEYVANLPLAWEKLEGKVLLICGATGMIGSFLVDLLMYRNDKFNNNCKVIAMGRNISRLESRFSYYKNDKRFVFISQDINNPILEFGDVDFIIHAASNTHPVAYSTDPIGTLTTNIIGTYNLLNYSVSHKAERFLFVSSVEIYGENRGDTEKFSEDYLGYIDCNTLRAGYPESKRAGEALCQAFIKQMGLDIVIARASRTYGPTMLKSDTKAISQFIKNGVLKEDIVLKSKGSQYYSYTYVADCVSGLLTILFKGNCGEAYNIADDNSNISLRDLAKLISEYAGTSVIYDKPNNLEKEGYSKATKAVLDSEKLQKMGWKAKYDIEEGVNRTLEILSHAN